MKTNASNLAARLNNLEDYLQDLERFFVANLREQNSAVRNRLDGWTNALASRQSIIDEQRRKDLSGQIMPLSMRKKMKKTSKKVAPKATKKKGGKRC